MQHLKRNPLDKALVVDIETVPRLSSWNELSPIEQDLFEQKTGRFRPEGVSLEQHYTDSAGILAEFGKIVCISAGIFETKDNQTCLRIKSYAGHDEAALLGDFADMVRKHFPDPAYSYLIGHNIREFDIPWLCRRMVVNRIPLPSLLDLSGLKPWEVNHVDTLQLWKFGDFKHYTSLQLLAFLLDIPSPKEDISGKDVGRVYWQENNLNRIVEYCSRDVLTVANVFLRLKGMEPVPAERVEIVTS